MMILAACTLHYLATTVFMTAFIRKTLGLLCYIRSKNVRYTLDPTGRSRVFLGRKEVEEKHPLLWSAGADSQNRSGSF